MKQSTVERICLCLAGGALVYAAIFAGPEAAAQPAPLKGPFVPLEVRDANTDDSGWVTVTTTYWSQDSDGNDLYVTDTTDWSPQESVNQLETLIGTPLEGLTCAALADFDISCENGEFVGEPVVADDVTVQSCYRNSDAILSSYPQYSNTSATLDECLTRIEADAGAGFTYQSDVFGYPLRMENFADAQFRVKAWNITDGVYDQSGSATWVWICTAGSAICGDIFAGIGIEAGETADFDEAALTGTPSPNDVILALDGSNIIDGLKWNDPDTRRPTEVAGKIPAQATTITNEYNTWVNNWTTGDTEIYEGSTGVNQPIAGETGASVGGGGQGDDGRGASCEDNPDSFGCLEVGDVTESGLRSAMDMVLADSELAIPVETVDVTEFGDGIAVPENTGGCPADPDFQFQGSTVSLPMQHLCDTAVSFKPFIILTASLMGIGIIMGQGERRMK